MLNSAAVLWDEIASSVSCSSCIKGREEKNGRRFLECKMKPGHFGLRSHLYVRWD